MSPTTDPPQERGMGILRRMSLSTPRAGIPAKPSVTIPPNLSSTTKADEGMKPLPNVASAGRPPGHRRVSTLSPGSPKKPRAPSPMGERMLKGHYDGF
ncbi:hypothetical protein Clacol_002574 [Clathrus columnatus]|uniref:Uncharacterized protein n=1 Tax=Clathrus columnatus TaxID=1419009 RepID=A0AAV5A5W3_9AGAM|nr:hypothetical protein Clacol_002574 [Clathrus columnatus]